MHVGADGVIGATDCLVRGFFGKEAIIFTGKAAAGTNALSPLLSSLFNLARKFYLIAYPAGKYSGVYCPPPEGRPLRPRRPECIRSLGHLQGRQHQRPHLFQPVSIRE